MISAIKRLDATAEVPQEAFDVEIIDMDFHVNPMEEERALGRLTTESGMTPIPDKWDAAYAIEDGNEGMFTQGRAEYPEDVRSACEPLAIDEPVVNAGFNGLLDQHHPVLKNAVLQAGNDYMLDHFVDEGFMTTLSIPKWDLGTRSRYWTAGATRTVSSARTRGTSSGSRGVTSSSIPSSRSSSRSGCPRLAGVLAPAQLHRRQHADLDGGARIRLAPPRHG